MKLFGGSNKDDKQQDDQLPDVSDVTAEFESDAAGATAPLTAPTRNASGGSGAGTKKIAALVVLLLAAGGGGYYALSQSGDEYPTAAVTPTEAPVDLTAVPADGTTVPPTDVAAAPAIDPVTGLPVTPIDPPLPVDAAMAAPAIDPVTGLPVEAAATTTTTTTVTNADGTVTTVETATATAPVDASGTLPADAAAIPADDLGAPPADLAETVVPVDAAAPDAPADAVPGAPIVSTTTTTTTTAPATDAAAVTAAANVDEMNDLPLPPSEDQLVQTPKTDTATTVATDAAKTTTTTTTTTTTPTDAEKAIVENAAVMDSVGKLPDATSPDLGVEVAMIRPLPQRYLVVKKDHSAGDVDSRLTAARLALSQDRTSAALQLFNELYDDYPRDKRVLMGRAVSLQKLGQNVEALNAYEDVLTKDPKNLEALTNMLGLLKKTNPTLANQKLIELRQAYPYNADITAQLGISYAAAGDYTEAMRYFDIAESIKPGSAFVLYNKGVLLDKMGRGAEAAEIYRSILRLAADGDLDQNLPLETIRRRLATLR